MPIESLNLIRERVLPMLEVAAREYAHRTPEGYPTIVDEPQRGAIGLALDPSHSLYFLTDGTTVFAEMTSRSSRTDARSSAGREKYGGMPFNDRRRLDPDISDQALRNLLAELMTRWNMQPRVIHITDT